MSDYSPAQQLAIELINIPSVTPEDGGCQELLAAPLQEAGCTIEDLSNGPTRNLLALHGSGPPMLLFLGHTDVVPPGDAAQWKSPPFAARLSCEAGRTMLYGRGSADMKGADACMTIAMAHYIKTAPHHIGTIALLVTSNEEGDGSGGVRDVVQVLKARGLLPQWCIVGEPSASQTLGDSIKIGRRGSLTGHFVVHGVQGHVAYPDSVSNPIHAASRLITQLGAPLDNGTRHFPPTSFQATNIQAGSGAENMVPGSCRFMCNWRFNDLQNQARIERRVAAAAQELGVAYTVRYVLNGEPFLCNDQNFVRVISEAIYDELGIAPALSTSGGTSDGRFIAPLGTQTIEIGLVCATIHQVNECIAFADLDHLTSIYERIIRRLLV